MDVVELLDLSATEIAAAIKAGQASPIDIIDAVLTRIERLSTKLNAFCTHTA